MSSVYVTVKIDDVEVEKPLVTDFFLMINNRFVLYKRTGDIFSRVDIDRLLLKKVQYFFVQIEKYESYKQNLTHKEDPIENSPHPEVRATGAEFVKTTEKVAENVEKIFASAETNKEVPIGEIQDATSSIIGFVITQKYTAFHLEAIKKHNTSLYQHSSNVAFLATYIAIGMRITSNIILENLCTAALLHDVGKTRLKLDILKSESDFSIEEKQEIEKHPSVGKNLLLATTNLPPEVLRMIQEHHEYFDGSGYPKGLKGDNIFGLTKFLTFANLFDNVMGKEVNFHEPNKTYKTLEIILKKYKNRFPLAFIRDIAEIFKNIQTK